MSLVKKITHRLHTGVSYIEHPGLLSLPRGVLVEAYLKFRQPWFQSMGIATILDIGANIGQSAATVRAAFPQAWIYSFEPLPDCFEQLQRRMNGDSRFTAFNIGIGDRSGELTFQRSSFSPSSSFLPMAETHKTAFPYTSDATELKVKVQRLDDIAPTIHIHEPLLVKIDVQGYEEHVLRGGEHTIQKAKAVIVETSFRTLYEGQPLFDSVYQRMRDWGYTYFGSLDQLDNPVDGENIQADSIFIRR